MKRKPRNFGGGLAPPMPAPRDELEDARPYFDPVKDTAAILGWARKDEMSKYYINIDDPQRITSIADVPADVVISKHNDLYKLEQVALPEDLVTRWHEAVESLDAVEEEILALEKEQMPAIERAQFRWMEDNKDKAP